MKRTTIIRHLTLISLAALLAILLTGAVLSYFSAYHFGAGTAYGMTMMGAPVVFGVLLVTGYVTHGIARRRGSERANLLTVISMMSVLAVVFAVLWVSTSNARAQDESASTIHRLTYAVANKGV